MNPLRSDLEVRFAPILLGSQLPSRAGRAPLHRPLLHPLICGGPSGGFRLSVTNKAAANAGGQTSASCCRSRWARPGSGIGGRVCVQGFQGSLQGLASHQHCPGFHHLLVLPNASYLFIFLLCIAAALLGVKREHCGSDSCLLMMMSGVEHLFRCRLAVYIYMFLGETPVPVLPVFSSGFLG